MNKRTSTAASPTERTAELSCLLPVASETDKQIVDRVADIARALGGKVILYFPVVAPPAPHTSVTPGMPLTPDEDLVRDRIEPRARDMLIRFDRRGVDAIAEIGQCHSITAGILAASAKFDPSFLMLPPHSGVNPFDRPFDIQDEEIRSKQAAPTWIVKHRSTAANNVLGLVSGTLRSSSADNDDANRVAAAAADLAERMDSEAHLLSCMDTPLSLARQSKFAAPDTESFAEIQDSRLVKRIGELAHRHAIPERNTHLVRDDEVHAIAGMIARLNIATVVSSGHGRRSLLGGWSTRHKLSKLAELECDLVVLGESDVAYT